LSADDLRDPTTARQLKADYLVKKQDEQEAERERRAALRDQQISAAEMKAAPEKLRKGQDH
jgi:hypothetical protein